MRTHFLIFATSIFGFKLMQKGTNKVFNVADTKATMVDDVNMATELKLSDLSRYGYTLSSPDGSVADVSLQMNFNPFSYFKNTKDEGKILFFSKENHQDFNQKFELVATPDSEAFLIKNYLGCIEISDNGNLYARPCDSNKQNQLFIKKDEKAEKAKPSEPSEQKKSGDNPSIVILNSNDEGKKKKKHHHHSKKHHHENGISSDLNLQI